ncbi:hypothetical protein [Methanosarcina mazei]|uniref:Uncharacterized protein n=1 Tax=Methanosarcina mazei TaxID=2209 RepID=A0A0F8CML7_METMZ|nr:hypothetical protein [Methanosarcina mazei]KKG06134.1 hypothetical protein DU47_12815 [Methanosarcina mazei]KKH86876.1 hypothetical protein DU80_07030 [Methanosarcina mazei]
MPLEPEELSPDLKLYNMIDKVVVVEGVVPSDPTVWEFHILGKVLKVDAEKLECMATFRRQYLKVFHRPAPEVKPNRWRSVLEALAEDKAEYRQAPEESEFVYIARQIFEIICERDITDDPDDAMTGNFLFKHTLPNGKTYFCMPSVRFGELVQRSGYIIPLNILSTTMTELGMKREGSLRVRYGGPQLRSWCFKPEVVMEQKGE